MLGHLLMREMLHDVSQTLEVAYVVSWHIEVQVH
jgi:hypothetical protein